MILSEPIILGHDYRIGHSIVCEKRQLNLSDFDPVPSDLDLEILSP